MFTTIMTPITKSAKPSSLANLKEVIEYGAEAESVGEGDQMRVTDVLRAQTPMRVIDVGNVDIGPGNVDLAGEATGVASGVTKEVNQGGETEGLTINQPQMTGIV